MNKPVNIYLVGFLFLLFLLFFFLDLSLGQLNIPLKDILSILFTGNSISEEWKIIILDFRLPKTITAILAGSSLSISGLQMQTTFRNPLADPYVMGISAGAGLGVAIAILGVTKLPFFFDHNNLSNFSVISASWIGSFSVLLIILLISIKLRDIMTVLILGILLGSIISAIISILQYYSQETLLKTFIIWGMGSLSHTGITHLKLLIPVILFGIFLSYLLSKKMDAFLLGENYAKSMGVNIKITRTLIFINTSLLAGSITAFCGPIGFIGIAVPHLAKLIFRTASHRILITGCIMIGSVIMLISDLISQLPSKILPINPITALFGIPIIIWIIIKNKNISSIS